MGLSFVFIGFTRNNNWASSCGWTPWTSVIGNWKIHFFSVFFSLHLQSKFIWVNLATRSVRLSTGNYSGIWKEHQIFLISALLWSICEAWKSHIYIYIYFQCSNFFVGRIRIELYDFCGRLQYIFILLLSGWLLTAFSAQGGKITWLLFKM